jgi:multidrug efflux pump
MDFSRFFIDRPIFAAVLSIVIFAAGLIAIPLLPIGEYPDVVPPSVVVRTVYPGANPKVIAETVATPLEEAINGVEDMMYFKSVAGSDGVLQLTVTFKPGTDADEAAVRVQNRVAQALARLPEDVRRQGVTTQKQSPVFLMVVHLVSKDGKYDSLYLRNYMRLHVKDELAKISGVGDAQLFGGGDYAMRLWLDPDKIAARGLTAGDVLRAVREQNVQVSAGQLGAEPMPNGSDFLLPINAKGRLESVAEFGDIVLESGTGGEIVRLRDVARIELAAGDYTLRARLDGKNAAAIGIFQAPGANALQIRDAVVAKMDELRPTLPPGVELQSIYDTTIFVRDSIKAVVTTLLEATLLVVLVVILFLQTWRASIIPLLAVPVSVVGTFAVLHLLGLFDQHADPVRPGAGDRHRGRRRDRGGRERGAPHRTRCVAARGRPPGDARGLRADHRHRPGAVRGVRADGVHDRRHRPVLQAVRGHHRDFHGDLGDQFADPVAGAGRQAAEAARCARRTRRRA